MFVLVVWSTNFSYANPILLPNGYINWKCIKSKNLVRSGSGKNIYFFIITLFSIRKLTKLRSRALRKKCQLFDQKYTFWRVKRKNIAHGGGRKVLKLLTRKLDFKTWNAKCTSALVAEKVDWFWQDMGLKPWNIQMVQSWVAKSVHICDRKHVI